MGQVMAGPCGLAMPARCAGRPCLLHAGGMLTPASSAKSAKAGPF